MNERVRGFGRSGYFLLNCAVFGFFFAPCWWGRGIRLLATSSARAHKGTQNNSLPKLAS